MVTVVHIEVVAGEAVYLPCDISTQTPNDQVALVLWYREDLGTPIYSVDGRDRDFNLAERWSDENVFSNRAYFMPEKQPAELGVDHIRETDQGVYRCRVDFRIGQTRNSKVNLTVIDSEHFGKPQKCENDQLQELLDDDPTQTQPQLAEALHVSHETIKQAFANNGEHQQTREIMAYFGDKRHDHLLADTSTMDNFVGPSSLGAPKNATADTENRYDKMYGYVQDYYEETIFAHDTGPKHTTALCRQDFEAQQCNILLTIMTKYPSKPGSKHH
ncbi:hypothetical protein Trydic_g15514 [Trypoxylus dichotomus]